MKPNAQRRFILLSPVLFLLGLNFAMGANGPAAPKFGPKWSSVIGQWKAEGGPGSGICGFHFDLGEHVIVRTNRAELSAGGAAHEDLMIISPEVAADKVKAIYFDNEGHTIDYTGEWSSDGNALTFTSKPGAGPQFRLTYKKTGPDVLSVNFEMASPGQPGAFKTYTSGKIRRSGN